MSRDVLFDGVSAQSKGLLLNPLTTLPTAADKWTTTSVDGAWNGTLNNFNGMDDLTWSLQFTLTDINNVLAAFRNIRTWLRAVTRFSFSDDSDVYYHIKHVVFKDATESSLMTIGVTIELICYPYQYAVSSAVDPSATSINNPGNVLSHPLFHIVGGSGDITINVNGNEFLISQLNGAQVIDVDSSLLDVFTNGNASWNRFTKGNYPVFNIGNNTMSISGSYKSISIDGRWCWK